MSYLAVIIAEYNPFHKGHAYHINETKRLLPEHPIVVLMSGHFVQRGEPALLDKWSRAQAAIEGGADLVVELPTVYALRSAEFFAQGAVSFLNHLPTATHLSFGVENPSSEKLAQTLTVVQTEPFNVALKAELKQGHAYSQAVKNALNQFSNFSLSANNLLALEYMKALARTKSKVKILPISRQGAAHHNLSLNSSQASASAIRHYLKSQSSQFPLPPVLTQNLPDYSKRVIMHYLSKSNTFPDLEAYGTTLLGLLRQTSLKDLGEIAGMSEGLERAFQKHANQSLSVSELLQHLATRRYPESRLRRCLCSLLLQLKQQEIHQFDHLGPQYLRVLAFNQLGRSILQELKKSATVPIITKVTHFLNSRLRNHPETPLQRMLAIDTYGTDWWSLAVPALSFKGGRDFTESPRYIKGR